MRPDTTFLSRVSWSGPCHLTWAPGLHSPFSSLLWAKASALLCRRGKQASVVYSLGVMQLQQMTKPAPAEHLGSPLLTGSGLQPWLSQRPASLPPPPRAKKDPRIRGVEKTPPCLPRSFSSGGACSPALLPPAKDTPWVGFPQPPKPPSPSCWHLRGDLRQKEPKHLGHLPAPCSSAPPTRTKV